MIRYSSREVLFFIICDSFAIILALLLSSVIRLEIEFGLSGPAWAFETPTPLFLLTPLIWIFALHTAHLYELRRNLRLATKIYNLFCGHIGACLLFFGFLYLGFRDYSRLQSFYFIVISLLILLIYRACIHTYQIRFRVGRKTECRVLIVGTDEGARTIGQLIAQRQSTRLRLIGYVSTDQNQGTVKGLEAPVFGHVTEIGQLVDQLGINELIVAYRWFDENTRESVGQIIQAVHAFTVNVRLAPDYADLAYFQTTAETFFDIPLIGIRESVLSPSERIVKRGFDIILATVALLLTAPIMFVIALLIRLDSPGPVLLVQQRIGEKGRAFRMFKFRSMYHHTLTDVGEGSPYNVAKLRDDPRITRVGRFLRRMSLDELPQFLNVVLGQMSLVGPRPEVPWMVDHYEWWQRKRFEVPQGMTGWWQINGRADKPMHFHTSDDLYYISNYSLWLDLKIVLRTVVVVVMGRGAY